MKHYLGIDIGTFESKGVLVDQTGAIVARATRPHKMLVPRPGWAEHRPLEDWWGDFTHISRTMIEDSGVNPATIRAVGSSAIGPCMLPVDFAGEPLMNAVLYGVDARAEKEIDELNAEIGPKRILDTCGNALTSQSVGPKILWLRRTHPDLFARAAKIVSSTSFLAHRLTGNWVVDHYTAANFSPIYDVAKFAWTTELTDGIVGADKLADPIWTTDIAGHVTAKAAAETGLAEGTPVIAGTIDAAAEAVSVGVTGPGDMMLMYGSTIFIIILTKARVRDARLWYAPWLFPGEHASMSGLATSGTLTHWFRDQFARELDTATAFPQLAAEAENSAPGANGLVLLPYFSGERTPIHDPHARGVLFGLDLTHTRGDIFRALLEGIAYGTNHVFETYAEAGEAPRRLFSVGGGTNNAVWGGATSDISGLTQIVREKTMGASYGDAFLAAMAVGDVALDDIDTWNPVAREIVPNAEGADTYARQYEVYKRVYEQTKDLMPVLSAVRDEEASSRV